MKLTNENKAKFFAQYWGQPVIIDTDNSGKEQIYPIEPSNMYRFNESHLLLTPLSAITDEDAIGACEAGHPLTFAGTNPPSKWICIRSKQNYIFISRKYSVHSYEFDMEGCPLIDMYIDGELTNVFSNEFAYQYLQSKGYALPFLGLSVEELIEVGWIKLTQNSPK